MLHIPPKPNFKRYIKICTTKHSLLRFHEYEVLDGMQLSGSILDVGGVKNSTKNYRHLFNNYTKWHYLNISTECKPDIVASIESPLPLKDKTYDSVLCMNTLEHVYDIEIALSEMLRITKPGGKIIISMPFIFQYHGDPNDYHRPTASWWVRFFEDRGIVDTNISITPLYWDLLSSGLSLLDNTFKFLRKFFRPLILLPGVLRPTFVHKSIGCPLGYIIIVRL